MILDSPNFNDDTISIATQLAANENNYHSAFIIISSSLPIAAYTNELAPHVQNLFLPHIPYNNLTNTTGEPSILTVTMNTIHPNDEGKTVQCSAVFC